MGIYLGDGLKYLSYERESGADGVGVFNGNIDFIGSNNFDPKKIRDNMGNEYDRYIFRIIWRKR